MPSLLGVLAVIAGLVYATSTSGGPPSAAYAVPLPSPHSIVRNGHTYDVRQAPVVAASAHRDPQVITLYVMSSGPSQYPECDSLSPRITVVQQDASTVAVAGFSYRVRSRSKYVGCTFGLSCSKPLYASITVRLAAPLAGRTIVDAHTGNHVGVLGGQRLPTPSYLPAGFRAQHDDEVPGGDPDRLNPPCVMDLAASYANRAGRSFDVRLSSASNALGGRHASSTVVIDGHPGRVMTSPYETCVDWEQPVGLLTEVCTTAKHGVPTAELIKVARGLH